MDRGIDLLAWRLVTPGCHPLNPRLPWRFTEKYKEKQIMKKVWIWIIGIVLGLVIIAVLVGVGLMVFGNFHGYRAGIQVAPRFSERGPGMMPYDGYGYQMRGPGMMGYGFGRMPFAGFFGGLLCLGFLALVVLGIIWLVRRQGTPKPVDVPAVTPAVMPAATVNPCKNCGRPIQNDWKVCPYCGQKV